MQEDDPYNPTPAQRADATPKWKKTKLTGQKVAANKHSSSRPYALMDQVHGAIVVPRAVRKSAQNVAKAALGSGLNQQELLLLYMDPKGEESPEEVAAAAPKAPHKLWKAMVEYTKTCQAHKMNRAQELLVFQRIKPE